MSSPCTSDNDAEEAVNSITKNNGEGDHYGAPACENVEHVVFVVCGEILVIPGRL